MPRAVLLFSGSLDSQLAAQMLSVQGIEIEPLFVRTPWSCGDHQPAAVAKFMGLTLHSEFVQEDYCEPLATLARRGTKATHFCGDCHLYLTRYARLRLEAIGADFVASGDVVGQKASNQKRRDYDRYAHHSGLGDRLLWPLSAQHLTPTWPECQQWVDRQRLGAFCGRNRAGLKRLARELGLVVDDRGSPGCPLGQTGEFGQRVLEYVCHSNCRAPAAFELLRVGHHEWVDDTTRVVVGRRQAENEALERLWASGEAEINVLIQPDGFAGPTAIVAGPHSPRALGLAISNLLRYAKRPAGSPFAVIVTDRTGNTRRIEGVHE